MFVQEIKGYNEAISKLSKPAASKSPTAADNSFSTSSMRLEKERLKEDLAQLTRKLETLKQR